MKEAEPIPVAAGTLYQCRFCGDWVVYNAQESSVPWRLTTVSLAGMLMEMRAPATHKVESVACGRCHERLESQGRLCAANPEF